jgi:hypothetical protein
MRMNSTQLDFIAKGDDSGELSRYLLNRVLLSSSKWRRFSRRSNSTTSFTN